MKKLLVVLFVVLFVLGFLSERSIAAGEVKSGALTNPIIQTLEKELERNFSKLKSAGKAPLYFLAYRLYEGTWQSIVAEYGSLTEESTPRRWRMSAVDLRVGSPAFDNSHYSRSDKSSAPAVYDRSSKRNSSLPAYGAGPPLRQSFWLKTDKAFKRAQSRFQGLKASKDVLAEEDDKSADFSLQPMHRFQSAILRKQVDWPEWIRKVKELSKLFLGNPDIQDSRVSFSANPTTRYIVTSEGTEIVEQKHRYVLHVSASSQSDDGMKLSLWNSYSVRDPAKFPGETQLERDVKELESTLGKLRVAQPAEPYVGPAIFSGTAAAVFFHETFGHRVEAIHEKSENEGKTFSKKIGTRVMPDFLTVIDDPTVEEAYGKELNGYYVYDDEGVPGQPVKLAVDGKLTGFLLGRALVHGFKASNGHGRSAPGWNPMGRQSNLFVKAKKRKQVSPKILRKLLVAEAKRQDKSYALYFDKVSGGHTWTRRGSLQTYSVVPLIVYKIYVDGRPDELIRGVDMVGTPLAALEHIVAAGTDYAVFNGVCGRESGKVPVSAVAPSLLIDSIEIKLKAKNFQKPPILPDPTVSSVHKSASLNEEGN